MTYRLVLSELRVMIEHLTTSEHPDPDFMRSHVSALASVVENWASEVEAQEKEAGGPQRPHLKPCG